MWMDDYTIVITTMSTIREKNRWTSRLTQPMGRQNSPETSELAPGNRRPGVAGSRSASLCGQRSTHATRPSARSRALIPLLRADRPRGSERRHLGLWIKSGKSCVFGLFLVDSARFLGMIRESPPTVCNYALSARRPVGVSVMPRSCHGRATMSDMALHRLLVDLATPMDPLEIVPREPRPSPPDRPWVFTNMVSTLDGATSVDGVSDAIGDDDDSAMFRALRASADVILVGSRTANVESYRPPRRSEPVDRARAATGRGPRPLVAVVSASLSIDRELELFADPTYRPVVFTTDDAPPERRRRIDAVADVVPIGSGY